VDTALDGTWGNTPPSQRSISGRKCLLKIIPLNGSSEELEIQLNPKTTGETEKFLVEVVDIGQVKYGQ
jgi:hypothetical protein